MHYARRRFGSSSRAAVIADAKAIAGDADCSCPGGCAGACAPKPGGASCPAFIPPGLVNTCKDNREVIELIGGFCESVGYTLASSVFLASLGVPLIAVGVVLTSIANNCDLGSTLTAHARNAAKGAELGAFIATVSVVGLPVAPLLQGLVPIFKAIGDGKSPKIADVAEFSTMANEASDEPIDLGVVTSGVGAVVPVLEGSDELLDAAAEYGAPKPDKAALKAAKAAAAKPDKAALKAAKAAAAAPAWSSSAQLGAGNTIRNIAGPVGALGAAAAARPPARKVVGLSTTAKVLLGIGALGAAAGGVYALTRKRRAA